MPLYLLQHITCLQVPKTKSKPATVRCLSGKTGTASAVPASSSKVRMGVVLGMSCDILLEVDGVERSRGIVSIFL
jgi:hypothetical protein